MRPKTIETLDLDGWTLQYRLVRSKASKQVRLRVGPSGVEVVHPVGRNSEEITDFVRDNAEWIAGQLARVEGLRSVRTRRQSLPDRILFRGEPIGVRVVYDAQRLSANRVVFQDGHMVITCNSRMPPARSLENWLRRRAREEIERHLAQVTQKLHREPRKVYVMGQRTKWGNCSPFGNLSFNWRLIMAPDFVLRYMVAHEATHLAVPDHSHRFWLTLKSVCVESDLARQWLRSHESELLVDLETVAAPPAGVSSH
jgi:predicted metal-dependent hydrolase